MTIQLQFPNSEKMHDFVQSHRDLQDWTQVSTNNQTAVLTVVCTVFDPKKLNAAISMGAILLS